MNISSRHSNSNFAHSFDFALPYKFCEKNKVVVGSFSLLWVIMLNFHLYLEEWSMDDNMMSKFWVGMFRPTCNIHYTPVQNPKSLAKTRTLNAATSELKPKKNRLKFLTLHSQFKIRKLPSWEFSVYFFW